MSQSCKTCRFSSQGKYYDQYDCRRRSPVAEQVDYCYDLRGWVPRFPVMKEADWCGDYEQSTSTQNLG